MANPTPGPWRVHTEVERNLYASHSVYICHEGTWPEAQLARVNVMDGLGEREANARLIAAAPALLEALVELRKWQEPSGQDPDIDAALAQADAAISLAKGESA